MRPEEYGAYMELFNNMVDAILMCKKPVICRVNGMRVAGGQEIELRATSRLSDLAVSGQAGPLRRVSPGGRRLSIFWALTIEDAMWNCISCEMCACL